MLAAVAAEVMAEAQLVVRAALAVVVMEALTTQERVLLDRQTLGVVVVQIPLIMTILESLAALVS
jgi:hypothetical protein